MAYLAPQLHWTFITTQGLGFSKTTGGVSTNEMGALPPLEITPPSHIRKLPPPLPWLFPGGLPVSEKTVVAMLLENVFTC
jgi:hypothetical protein